MDVLQPILIVACAERQVQVFDLNNPTVPWKTIESQFRFQTRCVSLFPAKNGFAMGGIEGRVWIIYFDEVQKNFSFKCHRQEQAGGRESDVYAVNSISFHQQYGTFCTAGGDGIITFWDKDSKQRLRAFDKRENPITSTCFNYDGSLFAYSSSYDWSKGHEYYNLTTSKNVLAIHAVKEEEVKPRTAARK
jgi:mRNA export factor